MSDLAINLDWKHLSQFQQFNTDLSENDQWTKENSRLIFRMCSFLDLFEMHKTNYRLLLTFAATEYCSEEQQPHCTELNVATMLIDKIS